MFYSHDILARKGPLGTIWIAAHLDRKLRKNQVLETDITVSVEAILSADLQKVLALRLSGHLLLGITRIFNRKVNYLYENCENALDKLKQAYKKGNVDLPTDEAVAPYEAVTLPDNYQLPDLEAFTELYATPLQNKRDANVASRDVVTLSQKVNDSDPFAPSEDDFLPPDQDGYVLDFGGPTPAEAEVPRSEVPGTDNQTYEPDFELPDFEPMDPMDRDVEKVRRVSAAANLQEVREDFPMPDAPTPIEKDQDTQLLKEQETPGLADLELDPTPAAGRDSLDVLLNDGVLPTPVGGDFLTPAVGGEGSVAKPAPKRRKLGKDRVIIDQATTIPGHEMDRRIKNPQDLVRPRKRAAHTSLQIRLQLNALMGLEALLRTPAVSGLGPELQGLIQQMLVKGKPESLPLTEAAEERLNAAKKQKTAEEEKAAEEEKTEQEKEDEAPAKDAEPVVEPTPHENGTASTPHEDFPLTDGGDFPPMEDHFDHTMPDGNWADGDTAPYPPVTPGDVVGKGNQAGNYPGLEDLLTGKTPGGGDATEDAGEDETPSTEDQSQGGGVKGWSVRTRGVANRLQQVFREGGEEKSVPLEGLLEGYGRRTAAKMFFEVLVLKTSNYIDVKQDEPYGNVDLAPTPQLMAAAF